MIGSRSCRQVQGISRHRGWRACGPEHGWAGGLVQMQAADDAVQWHLLRPQLLHLVKWPQPQQMPEGLVWAQMVRVCALLARRPSVGFRLPQLLGMEASECQQAVLVLYRLGCLQVAAPGAMAGSDEAGPATAPVATGNFMQRLWRRLAGLSGN